MVRGKRGDRQGRGLARHDPIDLARAAGRSFGQLKEGLFETDADFRLVFVNEFGARMFGFESAEACLVAGVRTVDLFADLSDHEQILRRVARDGFVDGYVCRMHGVRGDSVWIETTANPITDDSGRRTGYWGVFRDLTLHREVEQARDRLHGELLAALERLEASEATARQANEDLERRNRDLREFVAAVTHDLRAPLASLRGFGEMLVEGYAGKLGPRGEHLLERMRFNVDQMDLIIRGLLELVLLGEDAEPAARVEPAAALRTVLDNRRDQVQALQLQVEVAADLPPLRLQPTRFYQLLDNLVSNALKHVADRREARIVFGWRLDGDLSVFCIEDDGPGIEPIHRERVFDLFYRCDRSRPGAGIGLAIARRVVEQYGGRIWVEAAETGGARFCFTLPGAESPH